MFPPMQKKHAFDILVHPDPPNRTKTTFFTFFVCFPSHFCLLFTPPPPRGLGFPFFSLWRHHNAGRSTWDEWRFSLVRTTLWLWGRFANGKTGHWTGSFFLKRAKNAFLEVLGGCGRSNSTSFQNTSFFYNFSCGVITGYAGAGFLFYAPELKISISFSKQHPGHALLLLSITLFDPPASAATLVATPPSALEVLSQAFQRAVGGGKAGAAAAIVQVPWLDLLMVFVVFFVFLKWAHKLQSQ